VGLDQEALLAAKQCVAISPKMMAQHFSAPAAAWGNLLQKYLVASELGDHENAARFAQSMVTDTTYDAGDEKAYGAFAREERALNHDVDANEGDVSDAEATVRLQGNSDYFVVMPDVLTAFERGDMTQVQTLGADLVMALGKPGVARVNQEQIQRRVYPVLAEALARMGRQAEADALLKDIPVNDYDGWRARGRIAALRRDFDAGEGAFAEATRQAPSIPRAFNDWGDLLAAKGDTAGALAKYGEAIRRGPHFADPIKGWGDALLKRGATQEALTKYDEALKYAPNWKQLQEAREAAKHAR
jgi:tetratricopeptide (TPR) repeat protein